MSIVDTIFSSKIRTMVVRVLLFALVIEAAIWGIIIMVNGSASSTTGFFSSSLSLSTKFQLMFWVIAGLLISAVLGSWSAVKGDNLAKLLALIGICFAVVAAIMQLLIIWEVISMYEVSSGMYSLFGVPSMAFKIMMTCLVSAVMAIIVSLVISIEDNGDLILPSKIISIVCGLGFWVCAIFLIFASSAGSVEVLELLAKAAPLAGMLVSCFVVTTGVAIVLSWSNRRDRIDRLLANPVKEASETYQKVLDIQDEERARLAKEKAERDALPPLQSEEMAPTIVHDGKVTVNPDEGTQPEVQPEEQSESESGSNNEVL